MKYSQEIECARCLERAESVGDGPALFQLYLEKFKPIRLSVFRQSLFTFVISFKGETNPGFT